MNRSPYIYKELKRLDWLKNFSGNEIRALIFLQEIGNARDVVTKFTAGDRAILRVFAGISAKVLSNVLRSLEEKRAIVMLNRDELIVHPDYYILKNADIKQHRAEVFDNIYMKKHPAPGVDLDKTFIIRTRVKYE